MTFLESFTIPSWRLTVADSGHHSTVLYRTRKRWIDSLTTAESEVRGNTSMSRFLKISLVMKKNQLFAYAKTKTQISCAVTGQLISAFVFATWIVQSLFYLNLKFQASSHLPWLYSPVCVGPGRKPRRPLFSQRGSNKGQQEIESVSLGYK